MTATVRRPVIAAPVALVRRAPARSDKWSARRTITFILVACSPFWVSVACALGIVR